MNKFSWIKLVCYGCDMLIPFTPLQREAAMNGSLYGSYCEQSRQSHLVMQHLLMLEYF